MAERKYTDAERDRVRELYLEFGPAEASRRLAAEGLVVKPSTISGWAHRFGWEREQSSRTRAATTASRLSYERRRAELVDDAGAAASEFLARARQAKGARDARNLVDAFARAIDKAELLSGRATSRSEVGSIDDAQRRLRELRDQARDELAAKRAEREQRAA